MSPTRDGARDDQGNGRSSADLTGRTDSPPKKRKRLDIVDDESDGKGKNQEATLGNSRVGGIISDQLKDQRAKRALPQQNSQIVDLTNDDAQSMPVLKDEPNEKICLGVLRSKANVFRIPASSIEKSRNIGKNRFPRTKVDYKRESVNVVYLCDKGGTRFGTIEPRVAHALVSLIDSYTASHAMFKIYLQSRSRKDDDVVGKKVSIPWEVEIILYAPRKNSERLGVFLSKKQLFLEKPVVNPGKELANPNVSQLYDNVRTGAQEAQPLRIGVVRTVHEMRRDTEVMFDNLVKDEDLEEMEADKSLIASKLYPHQKKALHFLVDHERDTEEPLPAQSLWKYREKTNGQRAWYHVITDHEVYEKPKPVQGGILADVMGLGKTLSILALVASSRDASEHFLTAAIGKSSQANTNAKGTLIICPTSVLSNWQQQVEAHVLKGLFTVYTYHGASRTHDTDQLSKYDIVLTSYKIAASEYADGDREKRALASINWFRIVLDEAHSIRNRRTLISKACCALSAERRWAVTGTPVQNNLLDLGALIKFLRVKPLDDPAVWAQYIMSPFKTGDVDVMGKLTVLVSSLMLRRGKSIIDLPDRREVRERLDFTDNERALYQMFAKQYRSQFNRITSQGKAIKGKAYSYILKSILRLRMICAHGREMIPEEEMEEIEVLDPSRAIVVDVGDEPGLTEDEDGFISEKQAHETLKSLQDSDVDSCSSCGCEFSNRDGKATGVADLTNDDEELMEETFNESPNDDSDHDLLGSLTSCYHLICTECIDKYREDVEDIKTADHYFECPYCQQYVRLGLFPLRRSGLRRLEEDREAKLKQPALARWDEATYSGPHTKVKALIKDLKRSEEESKSLPQGEPPIRSAVFSYWTSNLDLIQLALTKEKIGFTRIDGSMSTEKRSQALRTFTDEPDVVVMLLSIKAAGQGLNLVAANNCYVMEPQYNPAVEQQAVDRIHRIGQKRDVTIKRFIMVDSIEENVLELQRKKERIASIALQRKTMSKSDATQEKMEELKTLFK